MKPTQKGNLYILTTAFLWSLGGLLLKYVSYGPMTINGLRCFFAFFVFWIYRKSPKIKMNRIIVLAAVSLVATNILYVAANKMTTAANAIVIQYTAPIWVLVWHCVYQRRAPQKMEILTMIMAAFGTILFFFDGLSGQHMMGNIVALFSGLAFSGVLFLNFLPQASSEDSSMLAFAISFLVSIPWLKEVAAAPSAVSLTAIVIIGVFQVGLAYVFFSKGSRLTSPVTASLIGLLEAVMNPLWVYLVYKEKVGRFALFGAVFILLAVAIQVISSGKENE